MPKSAPIPMCCQCTRRKNLVEVEGKAYCQFHDPRPEEPKVLYFPRVDQEAMANQVRFAQLSATVHGPQVVIQDLDGGFFYRTLDSDRTLLPGLRTVAIVRDREEVEYTGDIAERASPAAIPKSGVQRRRASSGVAMAMIAAAMMPGVSRGER